MYKVYLLKSLKDNNYYIGQTDNLEKRLKEHNTGKVKSTKARKPFILIGYQKYRDTFSIITTIIILDNQMLGVEQPT